MNSVPFMKYIDASGKELISILKAGKIQSPVYKNKRLYLDFSCFADGVGKVIVAGYAAGCNLNCYYCFSFTKDFVSKNPMKYMPPSAYKDIENSVKFYSPQEAFEKMQEVKEKRIISNIGKYEASNLDKTKQINDFTLRGCEPTIEMTHIFGLLDIIKKNGLNFILETNGIILGKNHEYMDKLTAYKDNLFICLTIKAVNSKSFEKNTRMPGYLLKYQYIFLEYLVQSGIPYNVTYMCGSNFNNEWEEEIILKKIAEAGVKNKELILKQDYIPFFVPEYKKKQSANIKEVLKMYSKV